MYTQHLTCASNRLFDRSIPFDDLFNYVLMKQGIIALCFIDGSTSCYDVSCDFNRVRLMSLLSSPDKLNHIIGWKVFAYPNDAETFFRSFYRLPGGYTAPAIALPRATLQAVVETLPPPTPQSVA